MPSTYAIEVNPTASEISRFESQGLVLTNTRTLLMEALSFDGAFEPQPGDTLVWSGYRYTVKNVQRQVNPTGAEAILFRVGCAR